MVRHIPPAALSTLSHWSNSPSCSRLIWQAGLEPIGPLLAPFACMFGGAAQFLRVCGQSRLAAADCRPALFRNRALAENISLFLVLGFLAFGSCLEAISKLNEMVGARQILAGYVFIVSSLLAFHTASPRMVGAGEPGVIRRQNLNLEPEASAI